MGLVSSLLALKIYLETQNSIKVNRKYHGD